MEMHQIRYFLAVSRTLNFTRAAEECNVAQPSLTKAIQKLEEELGGALLRRERGLTHLTDLGRLMLPHLEQTFAAAQAAKSLAMVLKRADLAPLRLGIADTIFIDGLVDTLHELNRALTGLQLLMSHGSQHDVIEMALRGDVDVIIASQAVDLPERLRLTPLFQENPVILTAPGHRLGNQASIDLADLGGETWIDRTGCPTAVRFAAICAARDIRLNFRHRAYSEFTLQQMVLSGMGCGISHANSPHLPGLVVRRVRDLDQPRTVVIATVSGRPYSQAADMFLRLVRLRDWPSAVMSTAP